MIPSLAAAILAAIPAQDLGIKAPPQRGTICIYNAHIHPVDGPDIPHGFITFTDATIREIAAGTPHVPMPGAAPGYTAIDAKGLHVYPGLVAAASEMGLIEHGLVRQTSDRAETGDAKPEVIAASAVNPDSTLLPVARVNGILTVCVVPRGGLLPGQASVIRMDAWTTEELPLATPFPGPNRHANAMVLSWPSMRTSTAWWMTRSVEEQQKDIKQSLERVETLFDNAKAYRDARAADPSTPTDLRLEAMRALFPTPDAPAANAAPGAPRTLPLFVNANDYDQITAALAFCKERGIRMVLVGGSDAHLAAAQLKEHDVPVIITGTHNLPRRADSPYDDAYTLPARLLAAGVRFAIASADDAAHERNLPYNAAIAVAHGLPRDAALAAVTLWPAEILGVADQVGSLTRGKLATLIVTDGDPLDATTKVHHAFIDGRAIDLTTKQSILAEKYRERYRQQKAAPPR